jgi:hypothetical protein
MRNIAAMPHVTRTLIERRRAGAQGEYFVVRTGRRPWLKVLPKGSVPPFEGDSAWFEVEARQARVSSTAGSVSNASAIFTRNLSEGFSSPRSTPATYRIAIPASWASCSCVRPFAFRRRRMFAPTTASHSIPRMKR